MEVSAAPAVSASPEAAPLDAASAPANSGLIAYVKRNSENYCPTSVYGKIRDADISLTLQNEHGDIRDGEFGSTKPINAKVVVVGFKNPKLAPSLLVSGDTKVIFTGDLKTVQRALQNIPDDDEKITTAIQKLQRKGDVSRVTTGNELSGRKREAEE